MEIVTHYNSGDDDDDVDDDDDDDVDDDELSPPFLLSVPRSRAFLSLAPTTSNTTPGLPACLLSSISNKCTGNSISSTSSSSNGSSSNSVVVAVVKVKGIHLKSKHSRFNGETYGIAVDSAIPTVYKPRAQEVDGTHCIGKDHCEYGSFGGCVMIVLVVVIVVVMMMVMVVPMVVVAMYAYRRAWILKLRWAYRWQLRG
ncbi:hypothetical protein HZH66_002362 [Vespula vulgaris]|uniref:Uncharacterized protein n=1 Tax=Vespula vulgaris TaxID=7454 RepID=A0A834NG63_VESVU|nr:hypothetical protein HZH66_002362 [Vespula vulgaris]